MRVRACVLTMRAAGAFMRACVRACVRVRACVCERVRVRVRVRVRALTRPRCSSLERRERRDISERRAREGRPHPFALRASLPSPKHHFPTAAPPFSPASQPGLPADAAIDSLAPVRAVTHPGPQGTGSSAGKGCCCCRKGCCCCSKGCCCCRKGCCCCSKGCCLQL